jgi:hypothetical protein
MSLQSIITGTFSIGQSQTGIIQLNELTLCGLTTGSNLSGSVLSFLVSLDGSNFYPLYDSSSAEVTISVSAASRAYAVDPSSFYSWNFIKLREGTSASAVLQATVNSTVQFSAKLL